jgi:hypothetical protein
MKALYLKSAAIGIMMSLPTIAQVVNYQYDGYMPKNFSDAAFFYKPAAELAAGYWGAPKSIYISYSIYGGDQYHNLMDVPAIYPNNTLLIRVVLPPGTNYSNIFLESNDWIGNPPNCPMMNTFSDYPGLYCNATTDGSTCGTTSGEFYDMSALTYASGGFSQAMFSGAVLTEPKEVYFALRNGYASDNFDLATANIGINIMDTALYSCWLNERPWAGGDPSNSPLGFGESCSVGIEQTVSAKTTLYPNPVENIINITSRHQGIINIYSITGHIIKTEMITVGSNQIDCSSIENGIYIVKITTEGDSNTQKITIKR